MEKTGVYHIDTDGFEKVLTGIIHMAQLVKIGKKCRLIVEYDPALTKTTIDVFTDKRDVEQVPGKSAQ